LVSQAITITASSNLTEEEIQKMVKDAELHAEEDLTTVQLYLVDLSASMGAREEGGTRLDLAKEALCDAIREKRRGDRFMIIGFSEIYAGQYLSGYTSVLGVGYQQLIPYLLMLVGLLVRPYGLYGTPEVRRV
jgi:hypothetical protein